VKLFLCLARSVATGVAGLQVGVASEPEMGLG